MIEAAVAAAAALLPLVMRLLLQSNPCSASIDLLVWTIVFPRRRPDLLSHRLLWLVSLALSLVSLPLLSFTGRLHSFPHLFTHPLFKRTVLTFVLVAARSLSLSLILSPTASVCKLSEQEHAACARACCLINLHSDRLRLPPSFPSPPLMLIRGTRAVAEVIFACKGKMPFCSKSGTRLAFASEAARCAFHALQLMQQQEQCRVRQRQQQFTGAGSSGVDAAFRLSFGRQQPTGMLRCCLHATPCH